MKQGDRKEDFQAVCVCELIARLFDQITLCSFYREEINLFILDQTIDYYSSMAAKRKQSTRAEFVRKLAYAEDHFDLLQFICEFSEPNFRRVCDVHGFGGVNVGEFKLKNWIKRPCCKDQV